VVESHSPNPDEITRVPPRLLDLGDPLKAGMLAGNAVVRFIGCWKTRYAHLALAVSEPSAETLRNA
jgi:hypothetical protein